MPDSHLARCLNVALRGLTLASKFVLLLAKFLAPERLGSVGMIAHIGLYALGRGRSLVFSQLAGFATFLLAAALLPASDGPISVAIAMCIAFGVVLAWKLSAYRSIQLPSAPAAAT